MHMCHPARRCLFVAAAVRVSLCSWIHLAVTVHVVTTSARSCSCGGMHYHMQMLRFDCRRDQI